MCAMKKGVLKILVNSQENNCVRDSYLRTPFLQNTSMLLLLLKLWNLTVLENFKKFPVKDPYRGPLTINLQYKYLQSYLTYFWPMFSFHTHDTVQKMKVLIKDFFSKYDQISRKLRIWSHLPNKSLMKDFIFCSAWKHKKIEGFLAFPGGI